MRPHLFVDITAHGLGHLAQAGPVLAALRARLPQLRLTVRSALPEFRLRARIPGEFTHLAAASDFGYVMHDSVRVDLDASAATYRRQHADWPERVAGEAAFLADLGPDLVLTDVAYLPLAGAARAGIPAIAMSSLNWADLFAHYFAGMDWAAPIQAEIDAAYAAAEFFLSLTPAMPMPSLPRLRTVGPVAALGRDRRGELRAGLGLGDDERIVLVAFGGFDQALGAEGWPVRPGLHWLVPDGWPTGRPDMHPFARPGMPFTDLLTSADAVLGKPGYGTFAEAACNGTPLFYLRRDDWPEQDCLIDWLHAHGRCREVAAAGLADPGFTGAVDALCRAEAPPRPAPSGADKAAGILAERLRETVRAGS